MGYYSRVRKGATYGIVYLSTYGKGRDSIRGWIGGGATLSIVSSVERACKGARYGAG